VTCVAVYCSWQCPAEYALREAAAVGRRLGEAGLKVVFGGGTLGPMGAMAAAARAAGAHVTAVTLPEWVEDGDNGCDELILVDTLAERVAEMERRADAFVVLGGGLGTLHELLSAWTDSCNGSHRKPIVVLDPDGLYAPLWDLVSRMVACRFTSRAVLERIRIVRAPDGVIPGLVRVSVVPQPDDV
jgi:uncharacterized protein (TIGR00730 family)